jgi:hypothetical protein
MHSHRKANSTDGIPSKLKHPFFFLNLISVTVDCGLYMMMCQANHATRAELYARGNSLHRHDANSDPPFSFFVLQQITTSFFFLKKKMPRRHRHAKQYAAQ